MENRDETMVTIVSCNFPLLCITRQEWWSGYRLVCRKCSWKCFVTASSDGSSSQRNYKINIRVILIDVQRHASRNWPIRPTDVRILNEMPSLRLPGENGNDMPIWNYRCSEAICWIDINGRQFIVTLWFDTKLNLRHVIHAQETLINLLFMEGGGQW